MNMKILAIFLLLLPLAYADWVDDNGSPSWLVYGLVHLENGTAADNALYTVRTYNHDSGGELMSIQTGLVGETVPGYLYNSRNRIDSASDLVIVEITYSGKSSTIVHSVTASEEMLHVIYLGNITLAEAEDIEEEEKNIGVHVDQIRLTKGEYLSVGELFGASVQITNDKDIDLEDVTIAVGVPDLGLVKRAGPFDLDDGKEELKELYLELPEWAEPGDYDIRITVSSKDIERTLHRVFTIE